MKEDRGVNRERSLRISRSNAGAPHNYETIFYVAKGWPQFFKISDIFFKYVSWLAILAATKYVRDYSKDYLIDFLYIAESVVFLIGLMWLSLYLIYSAIYDSDHSIARSVVLAPMALVFGLFLALFMTNPFMPIDDIIDCFEHRGKLSMQNQTTINDASMSKAASSPERK